MTLPCTSPSCRSSPKPIQSLTLIDVLPQILGVTSTPSSHPRPDHQNAAMLRATIGQVLDLLVEELEEEEEEGLDTSNVPEGQALAQ